MNLQHRIDLLACLGEYILSGNEEWRTTKQKASHDNPWFTEEFIDIASNQIAISFLKKDILQNWIADNLPQPEANGLQKNKKDIGVVMAGNIPLVGFHDFMTVFISGHKASIKPSSKDEVLIKHLVEKLIEFDSSVSNHIEFRERLKGCDGYIATGSNNSSRYFEYYFRNYPHIIRRNRTSVAILNGDEKSEQLEKLAEDVFLYFGRGCRNVTKIYVPKNYDFIPLLTAFRKYDYLADHNKYKNNYDYNLALHILNKQYFMSTPAILLIENDSVFSPVSQLNYEFYTERQEVLDKLKSSSDLQCIIGKDLTPFGQAQNPRINEYADNVNTLEFLLNMQNGLLFPQKT